MNQSQTVGSVTSKEPSPCDSVPCPGGGASDANHSRLEIKRAGQMEAEMWRLSHDLGRDVEGRKPGTGSQIKEEGL